MRCLSTMRNVMMKDIVHVVKTSSNMSINIHNDEIRFKPLMPLFSLRIGFILIEDISGWLNNCRVELGISLALESFRYKLCFLFQFESIKVNVTIYRWWGRVKERNRPRSHPHRFSQMTANSYATPLRVNFKQS